MDSENSVSPSQFETPIIRKRKAPMAMIQKNQVQEQYQEPNMESPVIVKSINRGITSMIQDAKDMAVQRVPQTVSNKGVYDLMYQKHSDYYEDKKLFIFDPMFEKVETALINTFEKAVQETILPKSKNAILVDDIKDIKNPILGITDEVVPRVNIFCL